MYKPPEIVTQKSLRPPGSLYLEFALEYKVQQSENGKFPSHYKLAQSILKRKFPSVHKLLKKGPLKVSRLCSFQLLSFSAKCATEIYRAHYGEAIWRRRLCRKRQPWSKFCIIEDIVVSYPSKVEIPVSRYL